MLPRSCPARTLAAALLAAAALAAAPPAPAQSVLVVVRETLDGRPLHPPLAAREGVTAALFDAGLIVMDIAGEPGTDGTVTRQTAVEAGADLVLEITVTYTSRGGGSRRLDAHAEFVLRRVVTWSELVETTVEATNEGREAMGDREALGEETGRQVAALVVKVLAPQGSVFTGRPGGVSL